MMSTDGSTSSARSAPPCRWRARSRSAARRIGVSGFLISCAMRRAASVQAASFCALISSVRSSSTSTRPAGTPPAPGRSESLASKVSRSPPSTRLTCAGGRPRGGVEQSGEARPLGVGPGLADRPPDQLLLALAQHPLRGVVGGEHPPVGVERQHAGGQVLEDGADQRALLGERPVGGHQLALVALDQRAVARQLLGHPVEGVDHRRPSRRRRRPRCAGRGRPRRSVGCPRRAPRWAPSGGARGRGPSRRRRAG